MYTLKFYRFIRHNNVWCLKEQFIVWMSGSFLLTSLRGIQKDCVRYIMLYIVQAVFVFKSFQCVRPKVFLHKIRILETNLLAIQNVQLSWFYFDVRVRGVCGIYIWICSWRTFCICVLSGYVLVYSHWISYDLVLDELP